MFIKLTQDKSQCPDFGNGSLQGGSGIHIWKKLMFITFGKTGGPLCLPLPSLDLPRSDRRGLALLRAVFKRPPQRGASCRQSSPPAPAALSLTARDPRPCHTQVGMSVG